MLTFWSQNSAILYLKLDKQKWPKLETGKIKREEIFNEQIQLKLLKNQNRIFEKFIRLDRQKFAVNLFLKQFETGSVTGFGEISQL